MKRRPWTGDVAGESWEPAWGERVVPCVMIAVAIGYRFADGYDRMNGVPEEDRYNSVRVLFGLKTLTI